MHPTPLALAAALLVAAPATALTAAGPIKMSTRLAGAAEVPGPGAPKGSGMATLSLDEAKREVCYTLSAKGTDTPTMAHIHKGAAGVAGPVVVTLETPAKGSAKGCAPLTAEQFAAIKAAPADYYVNVHTAAHPAGAVRGQLK